MTVIPHSAEPGPLLAGERPTSVRWHIVGLLMAYSFLTWFNRSSMAVAGTERIMEQYGISEVQMGVVYSALLLAYALCMTPGGWLIDRKGPWAALVIMGFGSAFFVALTGVVGWIAFSASLVWVGLLIVRALLGIFSAPVYPASARAVANWLPLPRRSWANGLVSGACPIGIASTYFVFGSLMDWFNWPTAFLIAGAATGAAALAWFLYATDFPWQHSGTNAAERRLIADDSVTPLPATKEHRRGAWLILFRNRSLMFLTLSYAAVGYFEYLFNFWSQYYFKDVMELGKEQSRLYSTLSGLAMAVGMFLGGWLSDRLLQPLGHRWGRAAVPMGGLLASAILVGLGISFRQPAVVVTCLVLAQAAVGMVEGPCWSTAIELGGPRGGTAAGIFNTSGNLGGLIAPVLTPWIGDRLGWSWAIGVSGVVCLIGTVLWLGVDPAERVQEFPEPSEVPGGTIDVG
jgi:MFS family permease